MAEHTVAILGGGVGGLSAAHELSKRGFDVHVYEMRDVFGGKARSIDAPGLTTDGRKPLPGEHGFRFFPGFYQHLTATMQEIPSGLGKTVKDHLVPATRVLIARAGKRNDLVDTTEFPSGIPDLAVLSKFVWDYAFMVRIGPTDMAYFVHRMLILLLSCDERRKQQWDLLSWWDFIGAENRSEKYQKFLADGLTRTLVAAQAKLMSARTGGLIAWQIVFDMARVGHRADQVLDGPTSEVWINPWVNHLGNRGVKFHDNCEVTEIRCQDGVIDQVTVTNRMGKSLTVWADYYVAAMPVDCLDLLLTPEMCAADPQLTKLKRLTTRWMNGVVFYLDQDVRLDRGHILFVDSEWALTAISQAQFWPDVDLAKYGDGTVKGVLSVDVSDWYSPGHRTGKSAMECNRDEIFTEVWGQILDAIDDGSLDEVKVLYQFIDPAIQFPNPSKVTNAEPLLINTAGSWTDRPNAVTNIDNLFLAADFVQTNTDLATMEAANEAARRAVNGILKASGSNEQPCQIFEMYEPGFVAQLRVLDRIRWHAERGIGKVFKKIGYLV